MRRHPVFFIRWEPVPGVVNSGSRPDLLKIRNVVPPDLIAIWRSIILSSTEKILFIVLLLFTSTLAALGALQIILIIRRGSGRPEWKAVSTRIMRVLADLVSLRPVFKTRTAASFFHGLVAWGFLFYLLVNAGDILEGFKPGYAFLGTGPVADLYRLMADVLSVCVLAGMLFLLARRFIRHDTALKIREDVPVLGSARKGIPRDSLVVGVFILLHVGARFAGQSFEIARHGADPWQPFANAVSSAWSGWTAASLSAAVHASWWMALGGILLFLPYFLYSKHIHLIMAPINSLLQPARRSMGELDPLDFEDESIEQFGVERIEQLSWKGLLDAYACIMCNRCQDACPAYLTGKNLSPSALEINKRYFLNAHGKSIAKGDPSGEGLLSYAAPYEAVWACTTCGACVDICPVSNEPMRDILEMRRHMVLMENAFPDELQATYRGMERTSNPWNIPPEKRLEWADGLAVATVQEKPDAELLWWVGCAPATDPRAQKTARAFAQLLDQSGVEYAVLGDEEGCTGDAARRSGNEYLFVELAKANVETLNRVSPKRIVTTCPHCLHTLKNEYPAFGGHFQVFHHTELLAELIAGGALVLDHEVESARTAFHDPCYLGRQNGVFDAPRKALEAGAIQLDELPRARERSFCCGAGGGQLWKEEESGQQRVSEARFSEAAQAGVGELAVGCPFCMLMLEDVGASLGSDMRVRDVAEILLDRLPDLPGKE
jgi:Fe-S oxidoreductase